MLAYSGKTNVNIAADAYICPNNKLLRYTITNKEDRQEFKSNPKDCSNCSMIKNVLIVKKNKRESTVICGQSIMKK